MTTAAVVVTAEIKHQQNYLIQCHMQSQMQVAIGSSIVVARYTNA